MNDKKVKELNIRMVTSFQLFETRSKHAVGAHGANKVTEYFTKGEQKIGKERRRERTCKSS